MILRVCAVITVCDSPRTISTTIKDVVVRTPFPVLVMDDGSESPAEHVLYSFEVRKAIEEGRVRVVRFPRRRGTGVALQYAMRSLADDGFTHMIVLRGDGSQSAKYIDFLIEAAQASPWSAVSAGDIASSYVIYPLFAMQNMRFLSLGRSISVEAALRFIARGIEYRELRLLTPSLPVVVLKFLNGLRSVVTGVRMPLKWASGMLLSWHKTQVSFAWLRPVARWVRPRAALVLHSVVAAMFLLSRPRVRRSLNEFYLLVEPGAGWRERQRLAYQHVFGFVERHSVVRVRAEPCDLELIPFLGRLAPVEIEQLPYIRDLEKSIMASPTKWSRLYPYWSELPPIGDGTEQNMLYEELKYLEIDEMSEPQGPQADS